MPAEIYQKIEAVASDHDASQLHRQVLIDRFGKDIIIAPVDDSHFRTTVTVAVSSHFLGWIMSLDGHVKVVGPDKVVGKMKDMIKQLSGQYCDAEAE